MKSFTLNNGHTVPMLGLGTWKSAPDEIYNAIRSALQIGYRHIDPEYFITSEHPVHLCQNVDNLSTEFNK